VRLVYHAVRLDWLLIGGRGMPHDHIMFAARVRGGAARRPAQPGSTPRRQGTNDPGARHPDP
jgi:hypothetical protein